MSIEPITRAMRMSGAFLDYQVIDHLQRIADGRYAGMNSSALHHFSELAKTARFELWMARITSVEMLIGLENPKADAVKVAIATKRDKEKLRIAECLGVRWLEYPCARVDDRYSRVDMTFAPDGSTTATDFEGWLEALPGVSEGDARQIVSLTHGHALNDNVSYSPIIKWFLTEDGPLQRSLNSLIGSGRVPELARFKICSVREFIEAVHAPSEVSNLA